jgi:8-oxo-dGTP pyrophosphatase MutT (NUDIX family)
MNVVDPRETYDDLLVTESRERLDPEEFEEAVNSEAANSGWVVLGLVFDDGDRVLLVDQSWADGWLAPGGARKPGESLSEAVVREVREETGVEIAPVRPRAVDEFTFVNERTGKTDGWTTVFFEADADTTGIATDLGLDGEEILDADWFERLPDDVFNRELTEAVYQWCLRD